VPCAIARLFNGATAFPDEASKAALRERVLATREAKAAARQLSELRDLQRFYHASDLEMICEDE
jgi:hypothetical protein